VERGIGTGTSIGAEALAVTAGISHRAITERILRQAGRTSGAALVNSCDGAVTGWPRFAQTVRAASCGLGRRGVADGDTVGVLVADAASYAIAVHAVRAAGATALGLHLDLARGDAGAADVAARLRVCRARILITSPQLAELATLAADRSWVRQVFAFGEAEGTTPFAALLDAAVPADGAVPAVPAAPADAGPAGGGVVVAAPPCGAGQAYAWLIDSALLAGATIVAAPVPRVPAALRAYRGTAAIVPHGTHVPGLPPDRIHAVA
jgi:non-ribosomal peptide synthetase component F